MAASMIRALRSGPDIRLPDFGDLPAAGSVGASFGTWRSGCPLPNYDNDKDK